MKTRIIADSSADLMNKEKVQVTLVPLSITFDEEEYKDGVTIDHKTFYEKLIESDVLPTTSQVAPFDFAEKFKEVEEAGESAVVITISSKLSGTYQSAMIAANDFENIYVVDGASAAIGGGILVEYALKLADQGMEAKEIAKEL